MHTGKLKGKLLAGLASCLMSMGTLGAYAQEAGWTVYTDTYRPFVAAPDEEEGSLSRLVHLVLEDMEAPYDIKYIDYGYAQYASANKARTASFPWRQNAEREENFLFSKPLATVTTKLFYNRRIHPDMAEQDINGQFRIGLVEETLYGDQVRETIDKTAPNGACPSEAGNEESSARGCFRMFRSEAAALKALLTDDIQLLPIPVALKAATMQSVFPFQENLIQPLDGISETYDLHLITGKGKEGEAFIAAFNKSFDRLIAHDVVDVWQFSEAGFDPEIAPPAQLVKSEGFPVITGRQCIEGEGPSCRGGRNVYYALPPGTRVLVLEWSPAIANPSNTDERLFRTMTEETRVLTLDEPEVGRELYVKTMHISLAE